MDSVGTRETLEFPLPKNEGSNRLPAGWAVAFLEMQLTGELDMRQINTRRTVVRLMFFAAACLLAARTTQAQTGVAQDAGQCGYCGTWTRGLSSHVKNCAPKQPGPSPSRPVSGSIQPSGFLLLGATAGSAITGAISMAKGAAAPEMLKSAAEGAFYGGVAAGLLWIVQGFANAALSYSPKTGGSDWQLVTVVTADDKPCTGLGMRVVW